MEKSKIIRRRVNSKYFFLSIMRLRKILWKSKMKQLKIAIGLAVIVSCVITLILYSLNRSAEPDRKVALKPFKSTYKPLAHIPLDEVYPDMSKNNINDSLEFGNQDISSQNMLNTPGCQIPLITMNYKEKSKNYKKTVTCGTRRVFLKKISNNQIQASIAGLLDCCYRFILGPYVFTNKHDKIRYTKCIKFKDKAIISLKTDFVNVLCFNFNAKNISQVVYDDVFAFTKRIDLEYKEKQSKCGENYNVLMIGMDSMSLTRFLGTMPRLVRYFTDNYWLGYRGYHKVADNTFPNLMAVLTGKNYSTLVNNCSDKMDECKELLIWNIFKKDGYVTAYAEDNLSLPDTFSKKFSFKTPPSDHYLRPLFLKGETKHKSLICAGKISSGQQLLNYALDFAVTYKNEKFFGLFWMNSYSHAENSQPQDADVILENFFNDLSYTGIMKNTFIIFFSDHGVRFGERRLKVDSYYDERLPMLFLWPPWIFRVKQYSAYTSLVKNQMKLFTPYDLHRTFIDIRDISVCNVKLQENLEACPKCHSIFELVSENRTCQDAAIHDKWCSCHKLYPLPVQDIEGEKCVQLVVSHIKNISKSIQTKPCWRCANNFTLKNILRIHFYYDVDKIHLIYVVAFTISPINVSYEATVRSINGERKLVGPVSIISIYRGLGHCTVNSRDRWFCLCQKYENC